MPPRGCGRGRREREQPPVRGRGRGRGSPTCEGSVTRKYVAALPRITPLVGIDPMKNLMWESFLAMVQVMVATEQANSL